jgi:hypothetical protein
LILAEYHEGIEGGNYAGRATGGRSCELAFGGLPYTEMLRIILEPMMYARELGNHPNEMKFH